MLYLQIDIIDSKKIYIMRHILFLALPILAFFSGHSQSAVGTLGSFSVGGSSGEGGNATQVVIGQTFSYIDKGNGLEVSAGLPQAHLEILRVKASVNEGDGYNSNGFSYPSSTATGTYNDTLYVQNGSDLNYDLLKILKLIVLGSFTCGELVYDGDFNEYQTVSVNGYCWTQGNMRAMHYADGLSSIEKALVYKSGLHPDENANENLFGRLYSWYSAVNVPENSSETPTVGPDGFVQGICPNGWHIPAAEEMASLLSLPSEDIRSTELWIAPNHNTNSTLFTSLPAGRFNAENNRYEGLLSETSYWCSTNNAVSPGSTDKAETFLVSYFCDMPSMENVNPANAISVRCVKNY